jgi:hypothetical protein
MPMKTPREILLRQHQAVTPKLDAIRAGVAGDLARRLAPQTFSWREFVLSLRWHLTAMSAAWVLVLFLNTDHAHNSAAMIPREKIPAARQIWAEVRESRRLLLQYTDAPAAEPLAVPGRRSELQPEQVIV